MIDPWAPPQKTPASGRLRLGSRVVLWVFLAIAGFFLITEHAAHLFGILPYLLVLLCPLLHLLHGGHGGHREHGTAQPSFLEKTLQTENEEAKGHEAHHQESP